MKEKTDQAIIRIRAFINETKSSNLGFAKSASLPESTIRRLFKNGFDPRLSTLRKMESVLPPGYQPKKTNTPNTG